jgi:hypothetical protein
MNVNMMRQGMQKMYPDAYFAGSDYPCTHGSPGDERETINGLLSIIILSMQCFEIIARHGHMQHGFDREGLIQDDDPYIAGLLRMMRNGIDDKG